MLHFSLLNKESKRTEELIIIEVYLNKSNFYS